MLFVSFTIVLFGEIIYVPGDYPTIQEAIDHALTLTGSVTIEVREGTYNEIDIDLTSSGLTHLSLIGVDGAGNCIIDGGNGGNVVEVENNYQPEKFFIISGFTIRNSITAKGIYAHTNNDLSMYLNVEISDNIIQNCHRGIELLRVNDCLVKGNTIINYSQNSNSFGISSNDVNSLIIDGNFISNFMFNISFLSTEGKVINNEIEVVYESESEGVHLQANSNVDIINNLFLVYHCVTGTPIRGIYNGSSSAKIINNTIIGFGDDTVGYCNYYAETNKFINNIMWDLETNIQNPSSTVFEVNYCCYNRTIP